MTSSADILGESATLRRLPGDDRIRARLAGMWIDAELVALGDMAPGPDRTLRARMALKALYALDREFHPTGEAGRKWARHIEQQFEQFTKEQ